MAVNKIIYLLRTTSGLKQKQFARLIGATHLAISQYERGLRTPSTHVMVAISKAFKIPLGTLNDIETRKDVAIALLTAKLRQKRVTIAQIKNLTELLSVK